MGTLWQDLRYGFRTLRRNPGFAAVALLTIALGIGANTAIFSLVDSFLLRPLPVGHPEQIAVLEGPGLPCFYADYVYFRDHNQVFSGLIGSSADMLGLGKSRPRERVLSEMVSGNYFDVLGVRASLGRTFLPEEDHAVIAGTPGSAVISYNLWKRRLGSDPNVPGKTITLDGRDFIVVGVAPAGFHGLLDPFMPDVWIPAGSAEIWSLVGRLKPGVTRDQAGAALNVLATQLRQGRTDRREPQGQWRVLPRMGLLSPVRPLMVSIGAMLLAVVGLVLLIAGANVANLLLARAMARRHEIAVRLALGASRSRLIRQLLTENLPLAGLGAAAGLILASWTSGLLAGLIPSVLSAGFAVQHGIDLRALGFTALLALLTSLLFGLAPALRASSPDVISELKEETGLHGSKTARGDLLVISQVALSLVVLIASGLFVRSLQRAHSMDVGFNVNKLIVMQLDFGRDRRPATQLNEVSRRLQERIATVPGVSSASLMDILPLGNTYREAAVVIEGGEATPVAAGTSSIDPQYFQTTGLRMLRGRNFSAQDGEAKPTTVVIVNDTMARKCWPGADAIGKRLRIGRDVQEVVGIVADSKYSSLAEAPRPYFYRPIGPGAARNLLVRAAGDPKPMVAGLRRETESLAGGVVEEVQIKTMAEHLDPQLGTMRSGAAALGAFGLLALLLASVGIYGVMAYAVARRTREIGLRIALGADVRDVVGLVLRRGMTLALWGVGIGLVIAFSVTYLLSRFLYEVSPTDAQAFLGASLLWLLVAMLASYIPALKAARVDPMVALRHE